MNVLYGTFNLCLSVGTLSDQDWWPNYFSSLSESAYENEVARRATTGTLSQWWALSLVASSETVNYRPHTLRSVTNPHHFYRKHSAVVLNPSRVESVRLMHYKEGWQSSTGHLILSVKINLPLFMSACQCCYTKDKQDVAAASWRMCRPSSAIL